MNALSPNLRSVIVPFHYEGMQVDLQPGERIVYVDYLPHDQESKSHGGSIPMTVHVDFGHPSARVWIAT